MKVLLLGEFSGFYKYLKDGLLTNGIDVKWYASGDGFKQIQGMDGDIAGHTGIKIIDKILYPFFLVRQFKGYDVVQIVNPLIFSPRINARLIKTIRKKNKLLVVSAVGTDYSVYAYQHRDIKEYGYYLLDDCDDYDIYYQEKCRYTRDYESVIRYCDAIIPGSYEYALAYKNHPKVLPIIRYPINFDTIEYRENIVDDKVIFFHGLNREKFKGTKYIREAMEELKEKYPDDVEIIIDGRMPFDKYLEVMQKANVIVDQCKSYGTGINALIAMAQGKVVLSGAEKGAIDADITDECPVWNIKPDKNQIFSVMEQVLLKRKEITEWGKKSREYIEKYYSYKETARLYKKTWEELLYSKKN